MLNSLIRPLHSTANLQACYDRYQSDIAVGQYCDAHYGPDKFGVSNFPKKLAQICATAIKGNPQRRALDLGCSVGRTTFELASHFAQVTGIDLSPRFIDIANRIKRHGRSCYQLPEEGRLISDHEISLADLGLAATVSRVTFHQGDVQCFAQPLGDQDLVLAANLIDRLPNPGKFLAHIHQRLVIGGLLVIASPYNWLENYTPQKRWIGGYFRAGSPLTSHEGLSKRLAKHFNHLGEPLDVEFVIRQTARTFNHNVSQVTIWRRIR